MEPEKLDLNSMNISEQKKQLLKEAFPEVFTEGGKIDFDKLKVFLGESVDTTGKEKYGMSWPGKSKLIRIIQETSKGTLRPVKEESVDWDATEHVFIEGDNLEVLKLLQKSYLGKIKMIYIDPPYNTGKDFVYPDNYSENLETYLEYTGQKSAEGKRFGTNLETDGRFHSKWLNMMYPRLFLARNLLREDGVIFISIDDNEVANLRKLCDEIFGGGIIPWEFFNGNEGRELIVGINLIYLLIMNILWLSQKVRKYLFVGQMLILQNIKILITIQEVLGQVLIFLV